MALLVADAGSTTQTLKTATGSGEHIPHHNVDSMTCGVVLVSGPITVSGTLAVSTVSGVVFVSVSGPVTVSGTVAAQISGTVPVAVTGTVVNTPSGVQTISGTVAISTVSGTVFVSVSGPVTVSGTVVAVQSGVYTVSGTVNAVATGVRTISGAVTVSGGFITVSGTLPVQVSGTVPVAVSGAVVISGGGGFITTSGSGGFISTTGSGGFITATGITGNVAHDAADSGNPVKIGGKALVTHSVAAVVSGDRTDVLTDKYGRLLVISSQTRDLMGKQATTITTTGESTIISATASEFHDITTLIITHQATSGIVVTVRDVTTSGTAWLIDLAAGGGIVATFNPPLQQGTATAWTAETSTTGVTYHVFAHFVKNI